MTPSLSPRALARIQELTTRAKPVNFTPTPTRDPKTGAFTVGGAVTADALRKAWRLPTARNRIPTRPGVAAFKSTLLSTLRGPRP